MALFCVLWALVSFAVEAVPFGQQKSFGHSIKGGQLPPATEVTTFEHTCGIPPCVVTQVQVPSNYPGKNSGWDWTHTVVSFYIDGEVEPSIAVTLLELAGEAHFNKAGNNSQGGDDPYDGGAWGIALMGRTAKSGGVYSTLRIPFQKSLRTTIRAAESYTKQSEFWFIIRGLEAHPIVLGDLELPRSARLRLQRLPPRTVKRLDFLEMAQSPAGTAGALARVHLDARGPNFAYLEACYRFFPNGAPDEQPLFLSSGTEDYFQGSSYFDEGMYKIPGAGLTTFDRKTYTVGAYKTHTDDPVVWSDGMRLVFRSCEKIGGCGSKSQCPNQFCNDSQRAAFRQIAGDAVPYEEYFLGEEGQTCTAACEGRGLHCDASMDLGDDDQGAAMMAHLNISDCLKNASGPGHNEMGLQWLAADQPEYVSGASHAGKVEVNYKHCVGFIGYPKVSNCNASFATVQRVCHCAQKVPPAPPAPTRSPIELGTLVWMYEWPANNSMTEMQWSSDASTMLNLVGTLERQELLTLEQEDAAVDLILAGDLGMFALLGAYARHDLDEVDARKVARQVGRYLGRRSVI